MKPFDRPHPVRANFGDPRTTFDGPPTLAGVMTAHGSFSFHFGIDIAVPDGTPVYPRSFRHRVADRLAERPGRSGDGFRTQYWHIVPAIRPGQHVIAQRTVARPRR